MADGSIPPIQLDRLQKLGAWLRVNGEAIYGTRPWMDHGKPRTEGKTSTGGEVRFTSKAQFTYAVLLKKPGQTSVTIQNLVLQPKSAVKLLGSAARIPWTTEGTATSFTLPASLPSDYATALRVEALP